MSVNSRIEFLNILVDNLKREELLAKLKQGGVVFTPNIDHLVKLQQDVDFYRAYLVANYRVCDSQLLFFLSRFLKQPVQEKISGADLFPAFCDYYREDKTVKIFLLGAAPGVAQEAMRRINQRCGREIVVAAHSPSFGFENREDECLEIVERINRSGATVLAVGVGAPKQEKWIVKYKSHLQGIKTFFAVGAAINFEAGHTRRAPQWVSEVGLEWAYRLVNEPARLWRRYLVEDASFFKLFAEQLLGVYKNPWHDQQATITPACRSTMGTHKT